MKVNIVAFLKEYSQRPYEIDRLIISAYLISNEISIEKNALLKKYLIKENEIAKYKKLTEFSDVLGDTFQNFNIEYLVQIFEFVISPSDRIITGAIYTPEYIRKYIVDNCIKETSSLHKLRAADIACGCGGFLLTLAKELKRKTVLTYFDIFKNNIFGLDIQNYSIKRTKLLLSVLAVSEGEDRREFKFNFYRGDALNFDWHRHLRSFKGFNIIVGNPPYVCSRNISENTRKYLNNFEVCGSGHPDLYIPFFQIGLEALAQSGILGYITMNTFFKSLNGRSLRSYFHTKQYELNILDFGTEQLFKSRNTYTCICLLKKTPREYINYQLLSDPLHNLQASKKFSQIHYDVLDDKNGWNLQCNELITKIEIAGKPFGEKFQTRNGIATLKNHLYIFTPAKEDKRYFYLQNEKLYKIEKEICKDIINPNRLISENKLWGLKEKIIFPYFYENDKATLLTAANFKADYPFAYRYLEEHKPLLDERDNGNGEYMEWFAFGRNQSLEKISHKLFIPHITPKTPHYLINSDEDLLFYNGLAVLGKSKRELLILKKIMESRLFWFYISKSSKPYYSGYYSLSRNYIKGFGLYQFNSIEAEYILNEGDRDKLDIFFEEKYGVDLSPFFKFR